MRECIDRKGSHFNHPTDGLDGTAKTIEDLAAGELGETEFIAWVRARLLG
jgi:hypothetical protein